MHVVHTEFEVAPGKQADFEEMEKRYEETLQNRKGFVSYALIRFVEYVSSTSAERVNPGGQTGYIHINHWDTKEDQLVWTASPEFATWRDEATAILTAPIRATFYETV